jgi:hypothetical protein
MKLPLSSKPHVEDIGTAQTWLTASASEPGKNHITVMLAKAHPLGNFLCSCPGFQFGKTCRHIDEVKEGLRDGD